METPTEYNAAMWMHLRRFARVQEDHHKMRTYYFSEWCTVHTDHTNFLLIKTEEHKDNTYRSGTKVFEYSKEFFQSIWATFNYLVPIHYGANITVWKNNT